MVGGWGAIRMMASIGTSASAAIAGSTNTGWTTTSVAGTIVIVAEVGFRVTLVNDEINWHLSL